MNDKINLLSNLFDENKLSHAILIETNDQDFCISELINLIMKMSCINDCIDDDNLCSNCRLIKQGESPNFTMISPDGKNIKKDQILELIDKCKNIPVLSKNNIYIIKNAEKLNNSSANSMLKFIEEPNDNCYGFFVTNSKDNIISTIKSRCESYSINYNSNACYFDKLNDDECIFYINLLNDFILNIENDCNISFVKDFYSCNLKTRDKLELFFNLLFDIYTYYSDSLINIDNSDPRYYKTFNYLSNNSLKLLILKQKQILFVLQNIRYNLNVDLLIDKFIIEMGDLNEKSICC